MGIWEMMIMMTVMMIMMDTCPPPRTPVSARTLQSIP
jgi:hypothetical protein